MVCDHLYDLKAVIMAWETMKTVNWAAVPPFSEAQWLSDDFAQENVSLFSNSENRFVSVCGVERHVESSVLTYVHR